MVNDTIPQIPIGGRLIVETRGNKTIYTMKSNDDSLDVTQSSSTTLFYTILLLFLLWISGCFDSKPATKEPITKDMRVENVRR